MDCSHTLELGYTGPEGSISGAFPNTVPRPIRSPLPNRIRALILLGFCENGAFGRHFRLCAT